MIIGEPFKLKEVEVELDLVADLDNMEKVKEVFVNNSYSGEFYNEYVEVEILGGYFELELATVLEKLGYKVVSESFDSQLDASVTVAVKDDEVHIFKHMYI